MYKFIKKPVAIEAFQMTKERRWDNSEWPNWLNIAWQHEVGEKGGVWCIDGGEQLYCGTLEGEYKIAFDDYIIQGVHGEIYSCKPEMHQHTYGVTYNGVYTDVSNTEKGAKNYATRHGFDSVYTRFGSGYHVALVVTKKVNRWINK